MQTHLQLTHLPTTPKLAAHSPAHNTWTYSSLTCLQHLILELTHLPTTPEPAAHSPAYNTWTCSLLTCPQHLALQLTHLPTTPELAAHSPAHSIWTCSPLTCPEHLNLQIMAPLTAAFTSALSKTMKGAFPPNSSDTFFTVEADCFKRIWKSNRVQPLSSQEGNQWTALSKQTKSSQKTLIIPHRAIQLN